jgi:hypothetical protein
MKSIPHGPVTGLAKALAAAAVLAVSACATVPPPTDELARAESAIKRAEEARVADYASPELQSAREKLVAARDAATRDDMLLAARLAEQSRIDAEVATAKTEAAKAKATIDEMKKANQAVQQEAIRNSNNAPPVVVLPPPPPANQGQ